MKTDEAKDKARKLGLSAWMAQASVVGGEPGECLAVKRIGFEDLDVVLGEGETWDEAFREAMDLIFGAR